MLSIKSQDLLKFVLIANFEISNPFVGFDSAKNLMKKDAKFGNPYLADDIIDILYHLGLDTSDLGDIKRRFGVGFKSRSVFSSDFLVHIA